MGLLAIYNQLIKVYGLFIRLAVPFSSKARIWLRGRSDLWEATAKAGENLNHPLWIHCASLGEFEQGRPIIEELKERYPRLPVLLTFFSPSGFEIRKNYPFADEILYLPLDTKANASRFLELIHPRCAIFVKYDFWFNFLNELQIRSIPFIYVSVSVNQTHYLLQPWSKALLNKLSHARQIFTQNEETAERFRHKEIHQVTIAGDTRIDRVVALQQESKRYPALEDVGKGRDNIIFGSVWPSDWDTIGDFLDEVDFTNYLILVAPHEIDGKSLDWWENKLGDSTKRLSQLAGTSNVAKVLVDTMGDLAYLYRYAKLAYVGGGFQHGIHSILEPSAALVPVIFGPKHKKFREAQELIELGAARSVDNSTAFKKASSYLLHHAGHADLKERMSEYLSSSKGATRKIIDYLVAEKLLHEKE